MKKIKTVDFVLSKKYDGFMGRCYRPTDRSYKNYGAKGIRVCSEWIKDIDAFRIWAKQKLKELNIKDSDFVANPKKYQIDRINGYKHYSPDNCTFSSPTVNGRNKTNRTKRVVISSEGEEILV
jgi:hypothetical protein